MSATIILTALITVLGILLWMLYGYVEMTATHTSWLFANTPRSAEVKLLNDRLDGLWDYLGEQDDRLLALGDRIANNACACAKPKPAKKGKAKP